MTTIAEVFSTPQTAGEVLRKYADVVEGGYGSKVHGSMEHFIDIVRDPLIAGSGCEYRPALDETGAVKYDYDSEKPRHYPSVMATFADRGIVNCADCKKYWEVPFNIEGDDQKAVKTGDPVERVQAYITPKELEASDNDGDEPNESDT